MEIILTILGLVIGCILMYFVLRPRLIKVQAINRDIEEQNKLLVYDRKCYQEEILDLQKSILNYKTIISESKAEIASLLSKEKELENHIQKTRETIEKDNEIIYQKSFDLMQEKLSQAADSEANKFQEAQRIAEEEYLKALEDIAMETAATLALRREEVEAAEQKLAILKAKADAAIAAAKREEEKLLEIDKYKILVSELDLLEINRLREIAPYFRNARAIYKIIWESYYRNLTTEMINRVVGAGSHTGIYKLTNLKNQKVYIGQAVKYRPMKNFSL